MPDEGRRSRINRQAPRVPSAGKAECDPQIRRLTQARERRAITLVDLEPAPALGWLPERHAHGHPGVADFDLTNHHCRAVSSESSRTANRANSSQSSRAGLQRHGLAELRLARAAMPRGTTRWSSSEARVWHAVCPSKIWVRPSCSATDKLQDLPPDKEFVRHL